MAAGSVVTVFVRWFVLVSLDFVALVTLPSEPDRREDRRHKFYGLWDKLRPEMEGGGVRVFNVWGVP